MAEFIIIAAGHLEPQNSKPHLLVTIGCDLPSCAQGRIVASEYKCRVHHHIPSGIS